VAAWLTIRMHGHFDSHWLIETGLSSLRESVTIPK
jgi:hypothetical protein